MIDRALSINEKVCPFSSISFTADQSVTLTRRPGESFSDFPLLIFLDRLQAYEFKVEFKPHADLYSTKSQASQFLDNVVKGLFLINDINTVNISVSNNVNYAKEAYEYNVKIQDTGRSVKQQVPQDLTTISGLAVEAEGGSIACKNTFSNGIKNAKARTMRIASGCAPGRHIHFNPASTIEHDSQGCAFGVGPPCLYYENDFKPTFTVIDSIGKTETNYTGLYTLTIVAGGGSVEDIQEYSQSEKEMYNPPGTKAIWTSISSLGDTPVFNGTTNSGLNWLCAPGSPCEGVKPKFPNTPEYFFVIEVSNVDVMKEHTYCEYKTRFVVRVHGLPMDFITVIAIVLSVIGGLFLAVIIVYFISEYRKKQKLLHPPPPSPPPSDPVSLEKFVKRTSKRMSSLVRESVTKLHLTKLTARNNSTSTVISAGTSISVDEQEETEE